MPDLDKKEFKVDAVSKLTQEYQGRRRRRRNSQSSLVKWIKKIRRRFNLRIIILFVLVMITVLSIVLGALISDAVADLRNAWQSLDRVLVTVLHSDGTDLTLEDFSRLQVSTSEMSNRLEITRQRINFIRPIINMNQEWALTADALDISQELVYATDNILSGVQPALNFMVSGDTEEAVATRISSGERVVELLELGQGSFASATDNLLTVENLLNEIQLNNISPEPLLQIEELRQFHQQLLSTNQLLISSPELLTSMLGLDEERSYLVLAQNNDELRPSGGYTSTYGWFTVRSGRIIDYDYSPTTATSPNPPEAGFLQEQGIVIPDWWIGYDQPVYAAWDGSWFADFPSTADMALAYYDSGDNPQSPIDGVLAIDISGFELMLDAMGEVFVADYGITITSDNFRQNVYDIRAFGQGVTPHKEFVASIYRAIFEEWSELGQDRTPDLLGAMLEGFQQNHIMFYFADDTLNDAIDTLGWSGRQVAGNDSDYLLVAEANLGNKSNNSINQPITYDVEILPDGSLNSRLTVGYEYFDDIASTDPAIDAEYHGALDYRSLLQIFLPVSTVVTDTSNIENYTLINQEDHTLLVTRSIIEYDTSERYQLSYSTPPIIKTLGDLEVYRLIVQNQPGSRMQNLNVQVSLPVDAEVISTSPEATASYNLEQPIVDFRLGLNGDILIEVIYQAE